MECSLDWLTWILTSDVTEYINTNHHNQHNLKQSQSHAIKVVNNTMDCAHINSVKINTIMQYLLKLGNSLQSQFSDIEAVQIAKSIVMYAY